MKYEILDDDGEVIHRIIADQTFMEANYAHGSYRAVVEEAVVTGAKRLTKLDFINRFTDEEFVGILESAKVNTGVEMWIKKLDSVTPDPDGTSIDLEDVRTVAGVTALETVGLIGEGRAAEILEIK